MNPKATELLSHTLQFIIDERFTNQWIEQVDGIKLYLRKSKRPGNEQHIIDFIDIASIEIDQGMQHMGIFSDFLEMLERLDYNIYIENVIPKHLIRMFENLGYTRLDYDPFPCFFLDQNKYIAGEIV